jgi:RNA-directed DNA polymerase
MIEHFKPSFLLPLFTLDDLEGAFLWISKLRKEYSPNSDIWRLRREWQHMKNKMLDQLNNGSYFFGLLDRYVFDDAIVSVWCSQDMIALKLIAQVLEQHMGNHIPMSCYHVKGHGGLKKAVSHTYEAVPEYQYVMRSDIKSYYDSVRFDVLMEIIERYVKHPVLLRLINKACRRTETRGGNFYEYDKQGLPMGSPLSPLLGAIALIPLDSAMGEISGVFYARFMDDWVVLTKSKTALRKVVKKTHEVLNTLKFELHPTKTYIGKISHGFNFLGYYMNDQKILPSKETLRRFYERALALYEPPQINRNVSRRYKKTVSKRDISEYQVSEAAPTDAYFQSIIAHLLSLAAQKPDAFAAMRKYIGQWSRWLKLGMSSIKEFETYVLTLLPSLSSCWRPGAGVFTFGDCR